MKGSDLIQITTAVFGLKWFDITCMELGISADELSAYTKEEEALPGPVEYAIRDIATRYMLRVESMQVNTKISDALLNGGVEMNEEAVFIAGMARGMALILSALHGEPGDLKTLAQEKDFLSVVKGYMHGLN